MSDTNMDKRIEEAQRLLRKHIGCIPGKPPKVSKDEIWKEIAKDIIDLE